MAQEQSLFGLSYEDMKRQIAAEEAAAASQYAQLTPLQQLSRHQYGLGQQLGGIVGSVFGLEDPRLKEAREEESILQDVMTNLPANASQSEMFAALGQRLPGRKGLMAKFEGMKASAAERAAMEESVLRSAQTQQHLSQAGLQESTAKKLETEEKLRAIHVLSKKAHVNKVWANEVAYRNWIKEVKTLDPTADTEYLEGLLSADPLQRQRAVEEYVESTQTPEQEGIQSKAEVAALRASQANERHTQDLLYKGLNYQIELMQLRLGGLTQQNAQAHQQTMENYQRIQTNATTSASWSSSKLASQENTSKSLELGPYKNKFTTALANDFAGDGVIRVGQLYMEKMIDKNGLFPNNSETSSVTHGLLNLYLESLGKNKKPSLEEFVRFSENRINSLVAERAKTEEKSSKKKTRPGVVHIPSGGTTGQVGMFSEMVK